MDEYEADMRACLACGLLREREAAISVSGYSRVPVEVAEMWAAYLDMADLKALRLTCRQANEQTFQAFGQRYWSSLTTSLMGPSLRKLRAVTNHEKIRQFVRTIHIEEDNPRNGRPGKLGTWPRGPLDRIQTSAIAVEELQLLFRSQQLCPTTMELLDVIDTHESTDPEVAADLACDIVANARLAVEHFSARKTSRATTVVTLQLCAQEQGRNVGMSLLRSAEMKLKYDLGSDWATNILYTAPILEDLQLGFCKPECMQLQGPLVWNSQCHRMPKLKRLRVTGAVLCAQSVINILSNSRHTLKHLSLGLVKLTQRATWIDLLTRINNEFPALVSFNLKLLAEGPGGTRKITFLGLDRLISGELQSRVDLMWKGRPDNRWIYGVSYEGADCSLVFGRTVASIVTS